MDLLCNASFLNIDRQPSAGQPQPQLFTDEKQILQSIPDTKRYKTELWEDRYSLVFQKPKWWWHYWLPLWNPLRDLQHCLDSPAKPENRQTMLFMWPLWKYLKFWSAAWIAIILQANNFLDHFFFVILLSTSVQFVSLVFSVPFADAAPASQLHHATTAGSNAAERCGLHDDVPSTPHCSPPERWCALPQTQYHLTQVRRGHKNVELYNSQAYSHCKRRLSCLPVYETGLPAKSDHFFTSASLMTSQLLRITMAAKTQQGCWCCAHQNPTVDKKVL